MWGEEEIKLKIYEGNISLSRLHLKPFSPLTSSCSSFFHFLAPLRTFLSSIISLLLRLLSPFIASYCTQCTAFNISPHFSSPPFPLSLSSRFGLPVASFILSFFTCQSFYLPHLPPLSHLSRKDQINKPLMYSPAKAFPSPVPACLPACPRPSRVKQSERTKLSPTMRRRLFFVVFHEKVRLLVGKAY